LARENPFTPPWGIAKKYGRRLLSFVWWRMLSSGQQVIGNKLSLFMDRSGYYREMDSMLPMLPLIQ
jgi:hypothetical protein